MIKNKIKDFLIKKFRSEADIDHLCRELEIENVYAGNYKKQITDILNDIETNSPDSVGKLYHAVKELRPGFNEEIDKLFEYERFTQVRDSVAVLFSDIKDFSKITNEDLKVKIETVNHDFKKIFESHGDFIFMNTWGDAFYVVYKTCTGLLQQAFKLKDYFIETDWKEKGFEDQLKIRIGLHHGEAVVMQDGGSVTNVISREIDTAKRIESVATPNVIFCSSVFRDMVKDKKDHKFYSLGEVKLAKDYGTLELYSIDEEVSIPESLKPESFDLSTMHEMEPPILLEAISGIVSEEVSNSSEKFVQAENDVTNGIAMLPKNTVNILRKKGDLKGVLGKYNSEFIGRKKEVYELLEVLRRHRLVTLLATGGIGKTRLALEVVQRMGETNLAPQGISVVPLDEVTEDTESAVLDTFVAVLKLVPEQHGGEKQALLDKFKNNNCVLLLDNCETASSSLAKLVETLLRTCPNIRILATSQKALGLRRVEQIYSVEPMLPPKSDVLTLAELEVLDSFQLFQYHAILANSKWHPEDQDASDIANILRLTDGIPLAIEFVAAWTPLRSLTEIAEELINTPLGDITSTQDAIDIQGERHFSLMRCLDWSFNLLEQWIQDGFAGLGIFSDTFTAHSVKFICERPDAQLVLDSLVKFRLVCRLSVSEVSTYSMLRLTRIYANAKLNLLPIAPSIRQRFISYYTKMAKEVGLSKGYGNLSAFDTEWRNVLTAAKIAETTENRNALFFFSRHLGEFLLRRGLWSEREKLNLSALKAAREVENVNAELCILIDLGTVYEIQGHWNEAREKYTDSLDISVRLERTEGQAIAWEHLSKLFHREGKLAEADNAYRQCSKLRENVVGLREKAINLDKDGKFLEKQGKWDEAALKYHDSLQIRNKLDDETGQANSLANLGNVFTRQRRWEEAETAYENSIKIWDDNSNYLRQSITIDRLGELYRLQGRLADAETRYKQSLYVRKNIVDPRGKAFTLCALGKLYRKQKEWSKSEEMIRQSLDIADELSDPKAQGIYLNELSLLYVSQNRWQDAVSALGNSLSITQKMKDPIGESITLDRLARVYHHQKEWIKAEKALQRSLDLSQNANRYVQTAITLMNIALLHASQGFKSRALSLLNEAVSGLEGTQERKHLRIAKNLLAKLQRHMREGQPWKSWEEADYRIKVIFIRNIAKNHRENDQWVNAAEEYKWYLEKCIDAGDYISEGITLNELGGVYRHQLNFATAEKMHQQALDIFSQHEVFDGQAASYHKLGSLYGMQKQWTKAEIAYKESLRIKRDINDDVGVTITLDHLADIYQEQKLFDKAEKMYKQSLSIIREIGTAFQIWETLKKFICLREERRNIPGAFTLVNEAITLLEKSKNTKPLSEAQALLERLSQENK